MKKLLLILLCLPLIFSSCEKEEKDSSTFNTINLGNNDSINNPINQGLKGYATHYNGGTYKTTNGGESWTLKFHDSFDDIDFIDENLGYASHLLDGLTYKTLDGGETWEIIYNYGFNSLDFEF